MKRHYQPSYRLKFHNRDFAIMRPNVGPIDVLGSRVKIDNPYILLDVMEYDQRDEIKILFLAYISLAIRIIGLYKI